MLKRYSVANSKSVSVRQSDVKPEPACEFIKTAKGNTIEFEVPAGERMHYRLFVYIYDGQGNVANANIPFYVPR